MNQTWLGIDPGLATIGWAFLIESEETKVQLLQFGTIETSKQLTTSERLLEIEQDMVELIAEFQPAHIAIEMPFFGRSIKAAGGVLQAFGVINLVCYRELGIQPIYLHQSSWKCHLGYGKADKNEVAGMVRVLFDLETLPIDDSVDAIGIGYAGLCGLRNNIG
ncbi:MAG: crossover junction endodeoxyribonuclease RuvC [Pleurocapsa minor HA4230-MV1]|jgi:crossover junction endodeoxyribonuclease RuvC|nr:crossover junction endodeoxyribonuclease RuvC [Pleurocapsa minor HA4230-MV1]